MPWTGLVLDEFCRGRYRRFFGSGPVQGGKTMLFFCIPTLYHLFEVGETVIVGVPDMDLAQSIYEERLLPVIRAARYEALLPTRGAGSRGGKFRAVRFGNGAKLRFMAAGAGDIQRSSHTARVVVLTEIDKMDTAKEASRETDPVRQIEARTEAAGDRALIYAECTMSTEAGRTYREIVEWGTNTQPRFPCPHCGKYILFERGHFTGWHQPDLITAREEAHYVCQQCQHPWTEAERTQALRTPVLVSGDQRVGSDGRVQGDPPRTDTFGFRWNSMASAMRTMANVAEKEWRAERDAGDDAQRDVVQFAWALPYNDDLLTMGQITRGAVLAKIGQHPRGVVPPEASTLTVFVDIGLYQCWWAAWAWRSLDAGGYQGYAIDYGSIEVPQDRAGANPLAILGALRTFRDDTLEVGWTHNGQPGRKPDTVFVDAAYQPDIVETFCVDSGPRYMPSHGLGTAKGQKAWSLPKRSKDRLPVHAHAFRSRSAHGHIMLHMDSDHWKRVVHDGFIAAAGTPGSLMLYNAPEIDHLQFARQIVAEREDEEYVPGKGTLRRWVSLHRDNHYFDCTYGALCAAALKGFALVPNRKRKAPAEAPAKTAPDGDQTTIRTTY